MTSTLLVTGAAGFIGSNLVVSGVAQRSERFVSVDALTYAGRRANLASLRRHPRHHFVRADIRSPVTMARLLAEHRPTAVLHLAAQTHVDRSISSPEAFVQTNVVGTFVLLQAVLNHWRTLDEVQRRRFRFLQLSTDEVFGSLPPDSPAFNEYTQYAPNSPYSASKAGADHLVRAWHETYGLPVLTLHSSNNFGPRQLPDKLVPLVIQNALLGRPIPLYGDGQHQRDWLYVQDHCDAIWRVLDQGRVGAHYLVGSGHERSNLELVRMICLLLDELRPDARGPHARLITHVADRPGHDRRYAVDSGLLKSELGWHPAHGFAQGLRKTVQWYLDNGFEKVMDPA